MKLPMRFRILHLFSIRKIGMSNSEIMEKLRSEYGEEGQFKNSIVELHLQSMRAVGLLEVDNLALDAAENLKVTYKITEHGLARLRYLPNAWKTKVS